LTTSSENNQTLDIDSFKNLNLIGMTNMAFEL